MYLDRFSLDVRTLQNNFSTTQEKKKQKIIQTKIKTLFVNNTLSPDV